MFGTRANMRRSCDFEPLGAMSGRRAASASAPSSASAKPASEPEGIIPLNLTELSLVRPVLSRGPDFVADTHEGVVRQRAELRRAAAAVAARSLEGRAARVGHQRTERADQCSLERVPTAPEGHLAVAASLTARRRTRRLKQQFGPWAVRTSHALGGGDVPRALLASGEQHARGAAARWAVELMQGSATASAAAPACTTLADIIMSHSILCCYRRARAGAVGQPTINAAVCQSLAASLARARQRAAHRGGCKPSTEAAEDTLSSEWLRSLDAATGRAVEAAGVSAASAAIASCVEAARSYGWIQPGVLQHRPQLGLLSLLQRPGEPLHAATAAGPAAPASPRSSVCAKAVRPQVEEVCLPAVMEAAAAGMAAWPVCMAAAAVAAGWLDPRPQGTHQAAATHPAAQQDGHADAASAVAGDAVLRHRGPAGPLAAPPGVAWPCLTEAATPQPAALFRQGLEPPLPAGFWDLVGAGSGAAVAGGRAAALLLGPPLESVKSALGAGAAASTADSASASAGGGRRLHGLAAAAAAGLAGSDELSDVQAAAALMMVDEPARRAALRALGGGAAHPLAELTAANEAPSADANPSVAPGSASAALAGPRGSVVAQGVLLEGAELARARMAPEASLFAGVVAAKWSPTAFASFKPQPQDEPEAEGCAGAAAVKRERGDNEAADSTADPTAKRARR